MSVIITNPSSDATSLFQDEEAVLTHSVDGDTYWKRWEAQEELLRNGRLESWEEVEEEYEVEEEEYEEEYEVEEEEYEEYEVEWGFAGQIKGVNGV